MKKSAKVVLFFIKGRVPKPEQLEAAAKLELAESCTVKFRNASHVRPDEGLEPSHGVCGSATPAAYREGRQFYTLTAAPKAATEAPAEPVEPAGAPAHPLGLPAGSPEDRDALKVALTEAGVTFAGNAKTDTLVALYREHVVKEEAAQ